MDRRRLATLGRIRGYFSRYCKQLVRIEFTVARFDDPGALGILEGRQVPVCRLVLNRAALADLINRVGQLGAALKKAGTVDQPAQPEQPKK